MRVQLFATCLGDLSFPEAVADAEALLREAGCDVEFPRRQVCCGQPAFNAGHRGAARRGARTFVRAFSRGAPVVAPSGSRAAVGAPYPPELLGCEPHAVSELSALPGAHRVALPRRPQGRHRAGARRRVSELEQPPQRFRVIARGSLAREHTQAALDLASARLRGNRLEAWGSVEEVQELRQRAHDARMRVIRDLDRYTEQF